MMVVVSVDQGQYRITCTFSDNFQTTVPWYKIGKKRKFDFIVNSSTVFELLNSTLAVLRSF